MIWTPILLYSKFSWSHYKDVYCILNSEVHSPTAISKWNTVFENDPLDWKLIFTVCFKTTKDSSLQWFEYRLIHRILPVGSYLKKIQIKPTDTFTLCKETVETIVHLFFEKWAIKCLFIMICWRIDLFLSCVLRGTWREDYQNKM